MKSSLVFKEITQLNMPYFNLYEILQTALKIGEFTLGVFIDVSETFDTVGHHILIKTILVIENSTYPRKMYPKIV